MNPVISESDSDQQLVLTGKISRQTLITPFLRVANSLSKKAARACSIFFLGEENRMLELAMRKAGIANVTYYTWKTRYRYLRNSYLRGAFTIKESVQVATAHHLALADRMRPDFLKRASGDGFFLWQHQAEDGRLYRIHLRYPYSYNFDGDLTFCMNCDGADIYIVTVTIAPGKLVGLPARNAILVSSIQGINGKIEHIRAATESCNNVSPPNMLLAAIEAFALKLEIHDMVGIGRRRGRHVRGPEFDYSGFWQPLSGHEDEREFYHIPLPFTDKPLESIQAKHRSRARKRRELRNVIRQQIIAGTELAMDESILKK
ncbi:MAG: hypothetical protein GAK35_02966 [Herbaspirillum frisingense]|uniref:DUF535 domain-containing protein n=1 Tax=Herbaspirillum frisingense TaxID=92645 RepID=A0A7V8FV69_9BURK|nr:MAG: hypothetical protein GAK35_02966 [Herbaspirillum frisingense]